MVERADVEYHTKVFTPTSAGGFCPDAEVTAPSSVALNAELLPSVNDGRWIVECPAQGCGGAQLASPDMDRFFCVMCRNADVAAQWRPVKWPKAKTVGAIEAALDQRPIKNTRNWRPGETVAALHKENDDHLV